MKKTFTAELELQTRDCDLTSAWRPAAVLEAMQEVAGAHSEQLGVGRQALLNRNIVWVITRMEVEMDRYPRYGDRITVETWPMATRRWFFPRYFVYRDAHGAELGRAASLWVLLDLGTRQMMKPDEIAACLPDNRDLPAPLGLPSPVTEVSGTLTGGVCHPAYSDMDMNRHVNNARYVDWACNALGIGCLEENELARFAVNYDAEVRPGRELRTELRRLDRAFSFCGFDGESRLFDVGGELRPRQRG